MSARLQENRKWIHKRFEQGVKEEDLTTGAGSNWDMTWWRKAARWAGRDLSCSILLKLLHWPFVWNKISTKVCCLVIFADFTCDMNFFIILASHLFKTFWMWQLNLVILWLKSMLRLPCGKVPAPGLNQNSRPQLQWFARRGGRKRDCWQW